jgi:ketopantoate hydroxymethyltransferase
MPYLVAADLANEPAGVRFRRLLERPGILQLPGAHDGIAAIQARNAGFDALYLSGAAMSASMGLPDLGIITVDEVGFFVRQVTRASGLPVLVDGDTGYGEALNVMHMARTFEDAGAAAVHIEDQLLPKKCGHLNDKRLASPEEMAAKVAAAARARRHLYLIARTDAVASEGLDAAVARAKLYLAAGADASSRSSPRRVFACPLASRSHSIRYPSMADATTSGVSRCFWSTFRIRASISVSRIVHQLSQVILFIRAEHPTRSSRTMIIDAPQHPQCTSPDSKCFGRRLWLSRVAVYLQRRRCASSNSSRGTMPS